MALNRYSRYKIVIDPESKKTQGLREGDVVRRQYFDTPNLIYSLMVVLETGIDVISGKESHYFIGALVEGNEPRNGELLDFVRVTSLSDRSRGGALYLTASDNDSPYMDVIDGLGTEYSLLYSGQTHRTSSRFVFPINGSVENPEMLLASYRIRSSEAVASVKLTIGYEDETDGEDVFSISTEWEYRLSAIIIDYPGRYSRELVISPELSAGAWCEVSDLNVVRLSDIASFAKATKARMGRITGITDPVFGVLEGYGAYFQNLYATRNVNIAGTLTAGDQNGFASTFYVGKIHKNAILDSIGCAFTDSTEEMVATPVGIGQVRRIFSDTMLEVQSSLWRQERVGKAYCFSLWVRSDAGIITFYQDEHHIGSVICEGGADWKRYKIAFTVKTSTATAMYIRLTSDQNGIIVTAPQLEAGETVSQYQPTDGTLTYTEDYGAWFSKGGIGGTIQNPLLKLNEDGSISSCDGSFVINRDGTGHFAHGKFRWTHDDIELTDITIRWGDLDEEAKDQILSQAKPSNIRCFVSSNLSTTQIYTRETKAYNPNWAHTPLILTPSLFISTHGDADLISRVADPVLKRPGIKPGSAGWSKNGRPVTNGVDTCLIADAAGRYALTIKANHIGQHAPYIRYGFQAVWIDGSGNETVLSADIQFTQLTNPGARIAALAYAPDGNIFKSGENRSLSACCDLWRGALIDSVKAEYRWGIRNESVFSNAQLSAPCRAGSYTIVLRSVANMIPGGVIYLIGKHEHTIQSVDIPARTVTLTTPLIRDYVVNSIVTTPLYDPMLGPGWAVLSETNPQGVTAGWRSREITITPDAVRNFETFKCAIKDTDVSVGNNYAGQVVFDLITFTDMSDPFQVEISGTKGFVIKNGENDIDAKAVVYRSAKEKDPAGLLYHYSWKLYNADGDQAVRSFQGKQITVFRTDIDTRGALTCEVYQGLEMIARGQIQIVELHDGEDACSVQILTDNGNSFINGNIATTLTAYVYKGSREITDSIPDNLFVWKRTSLNPEGDAVWNELHTGIGRHLSISDEDVFRRAMFTCEVLIY